MVKPDKPAKAPPQYFEDSLYLSIFAKEMKLTREEAVKLLSKYRSIGVMVCQPLKTSKKRISS